MKIKSKKSKLKKIKIFFIIIINLIILILSFLGKINTETKIQINMNFNSQDKQYLFNKISISGFNVFKIMSSGEKINITEKLNLENLENGKKRVWYSTTSEYEEILIEFLYFPKLSKLFQGSTFNSIKIKSENYTGNCLRDYSFMFKDCINLISIDLSNFTFTNVYNLAYMFSGCSNLKNVLFPNTSCNSVVHFYRMFSNCISLTSIDLIYFNIEKVEIFHIFEG